MNKADKSDIKYVGVNDRKIDLFEGMYSVKNGMSYNSYVIMDEKTAVFDTVDKNFKEEWLSNIKEVLDERTVDYLIVQHMEPDHSANIAEFAKVYPNAKIVASAKAFSMMKQFFDDDFSDRQIIVKEGDTLSLGKHELTFVTAPMVHWPEVIMTYDSREKALFSADAFGKFGALDADEPWTDEARRYYIGIVGKYGAQVQSLLKKAEKLDIATIYPLHGPVLTEDLEEYIRLYNIWSSYGVESDGVMIAYTSVYGNTKKAADLLCEALKKKGCETVAVFDLARSDMSEAVANAFRYGKLVLATTTYNGDVFPFMRSFILKLVERGFKNRVVGFIENGSWAPVAEKVMLKMLESCKDVTYCENSVRILSAVNSENIAQLEELADELMKN